MLEGLVPAHLCDRESEDTAKVVVEGVWQTEEDLFSQLLSPLDVQL